MNLISKVFLFLPYALVVLLQCNVLWWWLSFARPWWCALNGSICSVWEADRHRPSARRESAILDRASAQRRTTHDAADHRSSSSPGDSPMANRESWAGSEDVQWSQTFACRKSIRSTSSSLWWRIRRRAQSLVACNRLAFQVRQILKKNNFISLTIESVKVANLPRVPGFPPNTQISPELIRFRPTIHDNNVVLPQPDAPKSPYLQEAHALSFKISQQVSQPSSQMIWFQKRVSFNYLFYGQKYKTQ